MARFHAASCVAALVAACVLALSTAGGGGGPDTGDTGGLARGWGDSLPWTPLPDAFAAAQAADKPVMVVLWKTWCGACKALRPKFAASAAIAAASADFVMANAADDDVPEGDKFAPDGGYIPRILFFDKRGNLLPDVQGPNPKYKYFHASPDTVAAGMARVAARAAAERAGRDSGSEL